MAINKSSVTNTEATAVEAAEPMLTPEGVLDQVRALRERIPAFVQLPKTRRTLQMRRKARLNIEFAREAFGVVGASDVVRDLIGISPDELHHAADEIARWTVVESELHALLQGVVAANVVRRERVAEVALRAYDVSSQLVKLEEHAYLLPHVQRMRRMPKFGRRRSRPAVEPVPTQS